MVIGFDGSRAFNKDKTGTENYSYQLLKSLSKIDHHNQYIVYLRPGSAGAQKWPKNFKFITIKWSRFWTQLGLAKQTFKDSLDALFIPAHTSPLIHKLGLKTVVTVHDLGAEYLPSMHQLKQRLYLKWITHYQLKSATLLIAPSKATKEDLVKQVGVDPKKIEVVYEGIDTNLFKPTKSDTKYNSLKPYYIFVGTIQPRKNLDRLIKAFSKTTGANLVIAGSKGWLSEAIYKLPKKLGIADRVKFLGRVEEKDLPALYSEALALTFPSLFEGFGLPILEAQACGCAVLTSNTSSMPEVGGKGAVYVNPSSVEDIMRGMIKMNNQDTRNKLIRLGFENIKRFSWEKCAKETREVLENL